MAGRGFCQLMPARYQLVILAFFGFFNVYMLRVNLSVALVSMVYDNTTHTSDASECPISDNSTSTPVTDKGPRYNWDRDTQGLILGSFFYGYIVTQIPGGWLAGKYGGKKLFGFGVLCTAIFTLLTPLAAQWSVPVLVITRVLEGLGEGVTFPAMHAMWSEWAPPLERSKLVTLSYTGAQAGTVVGLPLAGYLCQSLGWPSVFYIFGGLGVAWFIMWMIFTADNPEKHRFISEEEKDLIVSAVSEVKDKQTITFTNTPWLKFARSPAVWALICAHFSHNWGFYTLLTCLPTFMSDVLHFELSKDALLSGLPYLFMWIIGALTGVIVDVARSRRWIRTGAVRKLVLTVGLLVPAACLVGVGYVGCEYNLAVVLLCMAGGFDGISQAAVNVNHLDISPKYASTLMGITNTVATIPGFLGPQVVGWLTDKISTSGTWRQVFYISAEIYVFGVAIYCILGSGEVQKWDRDTTTYEVLPADESDDNHQPDHHHRNGRHSVNNSYQSS